MKVGERWRIRSGEFGAENSIIFYCFGYIRDLARIQKIEVQYRLFCKNDLNSTISYAKGENKSTSSF